MSGRRDEFDVVVCGAGVAGMACAVELARAGKRVAVLETRRKLGGRATSFTDPRSGEELDNCQHVTLGCCTHYLQLLDRLGMGDALRWHSEQYWIEVGGRRSVIKPTPWLPAPAHGGPAILRASFLSAVEKVQLVRGISEVLVASRAAWSGRTFAAFLNEVGQGESVRRKFWEPVVVSACNVASDVASAAVALKVFQEGFLSSVRGSMIGVPRVPLARLYEGFGQIVERAGGEVMLGASISRITERQAELADGRVISGARVVCALPYERAVVAVDASLQGRDGRLPRLAPLAERHSPIIGVHVCLQRPVLDSPHAVLVDAPHGTQWLFARAAADGGQVLHAVISGASAWDGLDEPAVAERVVSDIRACLPGAGGVNVKWARMVREKRATFVCSPAFEAARPDVVGPSELLLAGDYCNIGWPSTMEGAARAGHAAAGAILGREVGPCELAAGAITAVMARAWAAAN